MFSIAYQYHRHDNLLSFSFDSRWELYVNAHRRRETVALRDVCCCCCCRWQGCRTGRDATSAATGAAAAEHCVYRHRGSRLIAHNIAGGMHSPGPRLKEPHLLASLQSTQQQMLGPVLNKVETFCCANSCVGTRNGRSKLLQQLDWCREIKVDCLRAAPTTRRQLNHG